MMNNKERIRDRSRRNRLELINAHLTRRDLARLGLLTGAGLLIPKRGLSARAVDSAGQVIGTVVSPPTRSFIEPLRRLDVPVTCTETALSDNANIDHVPPQKTPNTARGEGRTRTVEHQRYDEFNASPNKVYYDFWEQEGLQSFSPDLPLQTIWGYGEKQPDGSIRPPKSPGPVYHSYYGYPECVRMHNALPVNHVGFGFTQTTTHLHNGHNASESDGGPLDFFNPGQWYDQHYPNILAGYDAYGPDPVTGLRGDVRETLSTLWYHDHRFDFTAQNVYKGLVGMYLLFGPQDSGNEHDSNPAAFRLPSGEFDVPMVFGDKVFDPTTGELFFDFFNLDGILGDKFTVNGVIQPFMEVQPRKYRLRCLNGGPSRFYQLFLTDTSNLSKAIPFQQISNDGNLLPKPLDVTSITLSVAERMDIIVDFSQFAGKTIYCENRLRQTSGRGPEKGTLSAGRGNLIIEFRVASSLSAPDVSRVPTKFFDLPPIDLSNVVTTRTFKFERTHGAWAVNGKFFDPGRIDAKPRRNTAEIWVVQNNSGGWSHPIHIHHEEFQMLSRNGKTPPVNEQSRKDVARLGPNDEVRFLIHFRDWTGLYPLHCHNVVHEDHAMMVLFEIQP